MAIEPNNAPQLTCSQRVRFVLNAKKPPFAEEKLDLPAGDQRKPDYLTLNPNGVGAAAICFKSRGFGWLGVWSNWRNDTPVEMPSSMT